MDEYNKCLKLDEYLGNIEWYNITDNNIHQYIDKNEKNECNFLQAVALITNYTVNEINLEFAKDLLNHYGFSTSDDIYNLYIKCEDLFGILLQIPGRGNIARLYTYGEQIIKYLHGNMMLLNRINKKTIVEDEEVAHFIKKKTRNNVDHMLFFDKTLMISQLVNEFETNINECHDPFVNDLRSFFYKNCKDYLCSSDFSINEINRSLSDRKRRVTQDRELWENKRSKSNEITWKQMVMDKNYPTHPDKLRLCGTYGKMYKKKKCYENDNKYYFDRDSVMMTKIIEYVYNGGDNVTIHDIIHSST